MYVGMYVCIKVKVFGLYNLVHVCVCLCVCLRWGCCVSITASLDRGFSNTFITFTLEQKCELPISRCCLVGCLPCLIPLLVSPRLTGMLLCSYISLASLLPSSSCLPFLQNRLAYRHPH